MFEDYSERLFAHFVAGQWRAPFSAGCVCVPMPGGRGPGQIVPAGPDDVARAVAVRRGADMAASLRFASVLNAALPELTAIFELPQIAEPQAQDSPVGGCIVLGSASTALPTLLRNLSAGVLDGVIYCPAPEQSALATAISGLAQNADLPPGSYAMLHARLPQTEAALRNTGLPLQVL